MSDFSELAEQSHASEYLAEGLREGTIVLFLGAGASKSFGLPGWVELVSELRVATGLSAIVSKTKSKSKSKSKMAYGADELQRFADEVLDQLSNDEGRLIELIQEVLYKNLIALETASIFANRLLIAVTALLMGSRRGHIKRVVTLNYDNLLQWFLSVYGFTVRTVYSLPQLEGSEDVRIYHPHGYIPLKSSNEECSNFVILGLSSVHLRLGKTVDTWLEMIRHLLLSGTCLFVGMSPETLSDRAIGPLLQTCGLQCREDRPLGFWLLKGELEAGKRAEYQRNNIIPVEFPDYEKLADFLLDVCKAAGNPKL